MYLWVEPEKGISDMLRRLNYLDCQNVSNLARFICLCLRFYRRDTPYI